MSRRARSDNVSVQTAAGRSLTVGSISAEMLGSVIEIERRVQRAPWSMAMFISELDRPNGVQLGAWSEKGLCGYAFAASFADAWHLLTIAVDRPCQRSGAGRALIGELLRRLDDRTVLEGAEPLLVTLEVRSSNLAARSLYERAGFLKAGVRHGYYPDGGEDALIYWRTPATLRGRLDDVPGIEGAGG